MAVLEIKARAKVNLGLHVLAKRDDGYHDIDTVFARVALHDALRLEPQEAGVGLSVEGACLPSGPDNLAYRAAEIYLEAAGLARGVRITLEKRIPIAAGLGGGSSNAAAALKGLAKLYPADINLLALGKRLGADVPFFVQAWRAARARGIGERLTRLELPELHLVLVNPGIRVSAKDAYANVQRLGSSLEPDELLERLAQGIEPGYGNDLQPGVLELEPAVCPVLIALQEAGLSGVLMSGSGPTCFGLAASADHARQAAAHLKARFPHWWVRATHTL